MITLTVTELIVLSLLSSVLTSLLHDILKRVHPDGELKIKDMDGQRQYSINIYRIDKPENIKNRVLHLKVK